MAPLTSKTIVYNGVPVGEYIPTGDVTADAQTVLQFLKDKGYETEVAPAQAVYHQALAFAETAHQLYTQGFMGSARKARSVAPFIANAAFSIELYLKALLQKHGVPPRRREHRLAVLYAALPPAALDDIAAVTARCAEKRNLGEPPDLPRYLSALNNAFVEWRYMYEAESLASVSIQRVLFAMEVLHSAHYPAHGA